MSIATRKKNKVNKIDKHLIIDKSFTWFMIKVVVIEWFKPSSITLKINMTVFLSHTHTRVFPKTVFTIQFLKLYNVLLHMYKTIVQCSLRWGWLLGNDHLT